MLGHTVRRLSLCLSSVTKVSDQVDIPHLTILSTVTHLRFHYSSWSCLNVYSALETAGQVNRDRLLRHALALPWQGFWTPSTQTASLSPRDLTSLGPVCPSCPRRHSPGSPSLSLAFSFWSVCWLPYTREEHRAPDVEEEFSQLRRLRGVCSFHSGIMTRPDSGEEATFSVATSLCQRCVPGSSLNHVQFINLLF